MRQGAIYETGLDKNQANYVPLSPLTFLERAASVHPERAAVVHGETRFTWAEIYSRCRRLASALRRRGIGKNDTVSTMLPNVPAMYEAHFGVGMAGAVLNALNYRLDAAAIAFMLEHGEAKALITDREFSGVIKDALAIARAKGRDLLVIDVDDPLCATGELVGETEYEAFLAEGDPGFDWKMPEDEWDAIALCYTSGTTGDPKGVVTHHRGAYLNAISNLMVWNTTVHPVYLWTLPMFHCNGWCFPWGIAAVAGVNVCLRAVRAEDIFRLIKQERVDHLCGAPVVLNLLANAPDELKAGIERQVKVMTAASAPPPAVLQAMEEMNFPVTHVYGLTEIYGPAVVCEWRAAWSDLPVEKQAEIKARQGVRYPLQEAVMVADPETLAPAPKDGETIGEIFHRGNIVMKGYLKNPDATAQAFAGGWFHSGDLAVWHEDGYVEIKDRSKDIIISGGENISSIEVENALYRHPAIMEAAVVAKPDEKWGETPCAFVSLKPGATLTEAEVIAFCRANMANFKAPTVVMFGPLPKTSTGKVQKFVLRQRARGACP